MSSPFASGALARPSAHPAGHAAAEPGYATIAGDERARRQAYYGHVKGMPILKAQRWERPPGPGSNRPAGKLTPGPGAYSKLHAWPAGGFIGTARGYNHNASV